MQLIIGLGNPGKQYEMTRHNAGFLALDYMLATPDMDIIEEKSQFESIVKFIRGDEIPKNEKVLFAYPQTFMNDSGAAVSQLLNFYKLETRDILVIHDEVDLPLGTIKFTDNSGAAGHNGIKSIIEHLGTQEFRRVRIGVETRESREDLPTDAFVLQKFPQDEFMKIPFDAVKARVLLELRPKK